MSDSPFSFGKLLIHPVNRNRSTCDIFVSQEVQAAESGLGRLFVLSEISSTHKENQSIIKQINHELNVSFYNTEDLHVEKAFERALESVNQKIADLVGEIDTNWLDHLNTVVAVVSNDIIHLSVIGNIHAFLTRDNKISDILGIADDQNAHAAINPLKAFSNIISGDLQSQDVLLFSTTSLLDYFSQEKLKRTITDRDPETAMGTLEGLLAENENNTSFAAFLVRYQTAVAVNEATVIPATASPTTSALTPENSMDQLLDQQAQTGDILEPSLSRHMKERTADGFSKVGDFIKLKVLKQSPRRVRMTHDIRSYQAIHHQRLSKPSSPATTKPTTTLVAIVKKTGNVLAAGFHGLASLFRNRNQIAHATKNAPTNISQKINKLIKGFGALPRLSKIIIVAAIVVAFALTQGIYGTALSNFTGNQSVENERTFSLISQNILKAEAAFTYDNEEGAKGLLDEALVMLDGVSTKDKDDLAKIDELRNDITVQLKKTQHIIALENIITIANISTVDATARTSELVILGDSLYTFDPTTKTIYSVALEDGTITTSAQTELDRTWLYLALRNNQSLLLLNSINGADAFSTSSETIQQLTFAFPENANIIDITTYDGRLYAADINNNQIYRATQTNSGYGAPNEWIKDGTSITDVTSIAVDGFIYLLHKSGTITRLFQGGSQDWSLTSISPALERADALWTNTATENIYVLDSSQQRIIEFTKEGKLLNQYTSPSFSATSDFSVDPESNTVYVLSGTSLLSFPLQ